MKISTDGLRLIARFEGFSTVPYVCPAGYWTIGYGHLADRAHRPVTKEEAVVLLRQDATAAEAAVDKFIVAPLFQHQFDALVSFTFNLGSAALQRSSLRRIINRGEHEAVPGELLKWVFAGGRKLPGLARRRAAEARVYQGIYDLSTGA